DGSIGIINRPEEDFFPKGCEGWVPIAHDVLKEILSLQSLCTDDYLVPGANRTERHDAVYRRHSKWVSHWIKDRTKTSYELRRYAGSRLLDMGATIFEVRDFLRHRDVQTTQQWYAYRLQNRQLRTIGMRDLLPPSPLFELNDSNPHEMEMTKTGNGVSRLRCVPPVKQLVCFRAARPARSCTAPQELAG